MYSLLISLVVAQGWALHSNYGCWDNRGRLMRESIMTCATNVEHNFAFSRFHILKKRASPHRYTHDSISKGRDEGGQLVPFIQVNACCSQTTTCSYMSYVLMELVSRLATHQCQDDHQMTRLLVNVLVFLLGLMFRLKICALVLSAFITHWLMLNC